MVAVNPVFVWGAAGSSGLKCTLSKIPLQDGDEDIPLHCFHPTCTMAAHMFCLSRLFLEKEPNHILPIEGQCPG